MSRLTTKTKVLISVITLIVIALIVGITLYFVLFKNNSNSSADAARYAEAKIKLQDLYNTSDAFLTDFENRIIDADYIFNNALKDNKQSRLNTIPIAVDSYIYIFNMVADSLKSVVNKLNDIYTFIGNYDDSYSSFSNNKKYFQSQYIPQINTLIENLSSKIARDNVINNSVIINPENYYNDIKAATLDLVNLERYLLEYVKYLYTNELPQ